MMTSEPSNKATQIMQGVGEIKVDLNIYNLNCLDDITKEWTANLQQKMGEQQIKPKLGVRSNRELFVDTVQVLTLRRDGEGLGLKLAEIAGGRDDALGITIVTGVVPGGITEQLDILPGDSISQVTLRRRRRHDNSTNRGNPPLTEYQESISVDTTCLCYDATVQAICSLPEFNSQFEDWYEIKLQRIRRRPKISVKLVYPPSQSSQPKESDIKTKAQKDETIIELFAGENLRMGMLTRGVQLNDPLAKRFDTKNGGNCGAGGLCRTCAVSVLNGGNLLNPQRLAEQQMLANNPRWRLACKAIVGYGMQEGEITVKVYPRQFD